MTEEEAFEQAYSRRTSSMGTSVASDEDRDLGFGEKVARETRLRFLNRDGSFNVRRKGLRNYSVLNLYHFLLTMSWKVFLSLVLLLYFLSNIVFGFVYAMIGDGALVDTSEMPMQNVFLRGFFFSVQTFATIGYGTIHPVGVVPNLLVTVESYYSLLANALITGLVFARFSRPEAKIIFSKEAVIGPYRNVSGLMFRLVNNRNNQLIELRAQVLYARFVEEKNGALVRRFDLLKLERERVSFLPLAWTVVHPIDETSPLWGCSEEDLRKNEAEILVLLSAIDETFAQSVHTRTSYKLGELKWGYRFSNMYNRTEPDEPITIDVRKLSEIEKV
jgi:inward rectifier potassium channel